MCSAKEVLLYWFFKLGLWFFPFLRNLITDSYFHTAHVRQYLKFLLFFLIVFISSIRYCGELSASVSLKLFSDIFVAYPETDGKMTRNLLDLSITQ